MLNMVLFLLFAMRLVTGAQIAKSFGAEPDHHINGIAEKHLKQAGRNTSESHGSMDNGISTLLSNQSGPELVFPDFQVNENAGSSSDRYSPKVTYLNDGSFIIVWYSYRYGISNIYAQKYDSSGVTQGLNFLINDTGNTFHLNPVITSDKLGNFIIAWEDNRNGVRSIYAQRYNSNRIPLGANFKVNDDSVKNVPSNPAIDSDSLGNFVITWYDDRNGDFDIYAQRYNSSGVAVGSNFKVNFDKKGANQKSPAVVLDNRGNFIITWYDDRNGDSDIYAQRFNQDGVIEGNNFKVNDDSGNSEQKNPSIILTGTGDFIITWQDNRNGNWDIYAQRYDSNGVALGSNFQVNNDSGISDQYSPSITSDRGGNFIIPWEDNREGDRDIYARRYDRSGIPQGSNFKVNDDGGNNVQEAPSCATDKVGNFLITWSDKRNGIADIYAQQYDNSGTVRGPNFLVKKSTRGVSDQNSPSITSDREGGFIITWEDNRNSILFDIFAQRYDKNGIAQGSNFLVNDIFGNEVHRAPSITSDDSGRFTIVWEDGRNGELDIYAQRYTKDGIAIDTNFIVNDDGVGNTSKSPAISADGYGDFVVTWSDNRNGNWDIYAQWYNTNGFPSGGNFQVNDDNGVSTQKNPCVALDSNGSFVIAWEDNRDGDYDVFAQRYDSNGNTIGSNFRVNKDRKVGAQYIPSISMASDGNFVIVWNDSYNYNYGDRGIYAQRYDRNGIAQGSNFQVNDIGNVVEGGGPTVFIDNWGDYLFIWAIRHNYSGQSQIRGIKYDRTGSPIKNSFIINQDQDTGTNKNPACTVINGLLITAWQTFHTSVQGWDIFANGLNIAGLIAEPKNLVAIESDSSIILRWDQYRDADFSKYIVYSDTLPNPITRTDSVSMVTDTSLTFYGLQRGKTYYYRVTVINKIGYESDFSNEVSVHLNQKPFLSTISDKQIKEDHVSRMKLFATDMDGDVLTYDGVADTNAVSVMASNDSLILIPILNWNGISLITAIVSDGKANDSTSFKLIVESVNDAPSSFNWVESVNHDTIAIDDNNLDTEYILSWESAEDVEGDDITYSLQLMGENKVSINLGSDTSYTFQYQYFIDHWFESFEMLPRALFKFNVWAHDGQDSTQINNGPFELLVNRYEYLSTASELLPTEYILNQNYPNPFNPRTNISFELPETGDVNLIIFNILGERIKSFYRPNLLPGQYTFVWDGTDDFGASVGAGIYLYQLNSNDFRKTKKMILLK